ncbi:FecR domain-containing protein [Pseudomonas sp. BN414]|uniref:FecR domain-containing protein n=1 Tax=Pseudomonas sp. BN414 TaxID=2567888 RepID=UPI002453D5E1|nr:FecR domain-containing protein [Pseudomonas sp. BN414]
MSAIKPDHAVLQQAAHWYARLHADPGDLQTHREWQHWHGQCDQHRQAWHYVERVGQRFEPLHADGEGALQALRGARRPTSRRQVLRGLATISGVALLGWLGWRHGGLPDLLAAWRADYHCAVGEVSELRLADGTRLWLNSGSALDVDYRDDLRLLKLIQGEVLIETASDPRPLLVETVEGRLRPLGTRFSVLQREGRTELSVYQGAVEARNQAGDARAVARAGEQLHLGRQGISAVLPVNPARQSWSKGVLLADNIPLSAFVEELSRYRHGHLVVAPEVADLRVVGSFPLHDGEQALAMLEGVLPIRINRPLPWWISLEPR